MGVYGIDIDGIVADNKKREAIADEVKRDYVLLVKEDGLVFDQKDVDQVYYQNLLNSAYVHLDELMPGAFEYLLWLEKAGHTLFFFTSRPEHMRYATYMWLCQHDLIQDGSRDRLEMKPARKQFVKTVEWKPARAIELAQEMLTSTFDQSFHLVDDDEAILAALQALAPTVDFEVKTYNSLYLATSQARDI